MISKSLLENITLGRNKQGKLSLFYKKKLFLVIAEKVLFQIILDAAPSSFFKSIAEFSGIKQSGDKIDKTVKKLAQTYAYEKIKFEGKDSISISDTLVLKFTKKLLNEKKTVAEFSKAVDIMKEVEMLDCSEFIKAQLSGLKFVNNNRGVFPKVSQLCSSSSISRALEYKSTIKSNVGKQDKPKNYWYYSDAVDGERTLAENLKYQEALEKIKKGTADVDATLYARRCFFKRRNGKSYNIIENHLKKISN